MMKMVSFMYTFFNHKKKKKKSIKTIYYQNETRLKTHKR